VRSIVTRIRLIPLSVPDFPKTLKTKKNSQILIFLDFFFSIQKDETNKIIAEIKITSIKITLI
jgi:hypothetical protein